MATNNFKPFANANSANVTTQADYEALAALLTGFQAGKASSAQINKALRQSSVMAYVLAQFISDSAVTDVLDNGTPATILTNLKAGLIANANSTARSRKLTASGNFTVPAGVTTLYLTGCGGVAVAAEPVQTTIAPHLRRVDRAGRGRQRLKCP